MRDNSLNQFIEQLQADREIDVIFWKKHPELRKQLVDDTYPDKAHFIFELLQNSEDALASNVHFVIHDEYLEVTHDGKKVFTESDITAITDFSKSAKTNSEGTIGKFGIGFKSVFKYTDTPHIYSGSFSIKIRDLVYPEIIPKLSGHDESTRFIFPFNNPKKSPSQAVAEIEKGLCALKDNVLLFLTHIRKISYRLSDDTVGLLERIDHGDGRIEIRTNHPKTKESASQWLRFEKDTAVIDDDGKTKNCRIAIAYCLYDANKINENLYRSVEELYFSVRTANCLKNAGIKLIGELVSKSESEMLSTQNFGRKSLNEIKEILSGMGFTFGMRLGSFPEIPKEKNTKAPSWKIIPVEGQVSIYFPAEKEESKLHFHIHAPFASTVARAEVRDCDANKELRDHLGQLVVDSLPIIRDMGMLTPSFLAVLPNKDDNLLEFYEPIQNAIIGAFQNSPLTPMKSGGHEAASGIFHTPTEISDVIDDNDLHLLLDDNEYDPPFWVAPTTDKRGKLFLEKNLAIEEWGWSELTDSITHIYQTEQKRSIEKWISHKDDEWLTRYYTLLGKAIRQHDQYISVGDLKIVKVLSESGERFVSPKDAFLPLKESLNLPTNINFVKPSTYNSINEQQNKYAMVFLRHIGVRDFNIKTIIELKLCTYKTTNCQIDENSHIKDIALFISYIRDNPADIGIFRDHYFIRGISDSGAVVWSPPNKICLDAPFLETGLAKLSHIHNRLVLWSGYKELLKEISTDEFVAFLQNMKVMDKLEVIWNSTGKRGRTEKLHKDYSGSVRERNPTDNDYTIDYLDKYVDVRTVSCSRLIWEAILRADSKVKEAEYSPNSKFQPRRDESRLVILLKSKPWIPDSSGNFKRPQEITPNELRHDFIADYRNGLLEAIGLGENFRKETELYREKNHQAKGLGFTSADELEESVSLLKETGMTPAEIKAIVAKSKPIEQPVTQVKNPEYLQNKMLNRIQDAPSVEREMRLHSIRVGSREDSEEAKEFLRPIYHNDSNQMTCQCCGDEMPFKYYDKRRSCELYYFEAVQFVDDIEKRLKEKYLALCPTCSAKWQYRETDHTSLKKIFMECCSSNESAELKVPVTLAGKAHSIRFVDKHWRALKTILGAKINE